jgi:hypothetical protein
LASPARLSLAASHSVTCTSKLISHDHRHHPHGEMPCLWP